jgi:drug/metabolite transporter (DMT)-like permease
VIEARLGTKLPLAELALVGVSAIWGLTFIMVKDAVKFLPVTTFLSYRFIPAAALVGLVYRRKLAHMSADGWRAGLVMGFFLTGGYVLQTFGLQRTDAASAGFITGMFVVLTPVFGGLFLRQRSGALAWIAAALSALGLFLMTGAGGSVHATGDLLVLGCACSFALHILATDRAAKAHDVGALLAVQLAVCGIVALLAAGAQGELLVPRSPTVWWALGVTSLLASALGFFVQTYAQRHASPARTALILASEPAFAGLFAYALAGQTPSVTGWTGAALIMLAIIIVELVGYFGLYQRPLPER